jgi:UDP-N-acetylmuramoyl-L-alanyl-D-glutamate--2,6-diaminopimelate ligase
MQLGDLLDDFALDVATSRIEIDCVEIDSRQCRSGTLFFALPGSTVDGTKFAGDAVHAGAAAIVASEPLSLDVPVIVVPDTQLRALLAHASATVVGHPEDGIDLVGVTGTNGKTSVTTMVRDLARGLGWNGANIGTLTNERTTPAPPELFRTLRDLVDGFDTQRRHSVVALEVSSHALDQRRVEGLRFAVAAFTNLSHDHLDYHGSMDRYFTAKAQLFTAEHAQRAVIWCDDPYGERLADLTALSVTAVRRADASEVTASLLGTSFFWRGHLVNTALIGDYNVDNALVAMAALGALGAGDAAIASAMSDVHNVPGRFEVVTSDGVVVIVDYAHTPEGLRRLLGDVRALAPASRLLTVFGCGGERDRSKRPEMGQVASTYSDVTIVTSDNPRSESPDDIIDAIMAGVVPGSDATRVSDRRMAIAEALTRAALGDVVVIAGKGHETTQNTGGVVVQFDDRAVALELLG